MRRDAWPAAPQRLLPDAEIGDGEVSRVMLHKLEHPCPLAIISKSGPNVRYWHKADVAAVLNDVRLGKADINRRQSNVRFSPKAEIRDYQILQPDDLNRATTRAWIFSE
jgi:hypothetical protein